ncbi:dTDP-4-dehydrorhamnose 3,5-epimerase [Polystyrenella longa]|uniref:dTDP-4-dehydrorhamnose 3,5-epimerase n=1 Tax=Polystyrenella longa TaxID=2528007 RepID=A0A518CPA6_9PLAN|nr:dTDP-4-dehydrorhamnose 3,5-epimerase [Polystyrenella longa]QDU81055.1 dTDP-4-dehydrorhamnose 3,5-epimerase [Polystyrenella longa]
MEVRPTSIPDVLLIKPSVFEDARGFFKETYQEERYHKIGVGVQFVQDNNSRSQRGTLRGLHYQLEHSQGKLVQVFRGEIFDVAVDLRRSSPTFGKWTSAILSEHNHLQLYIPPGFAHGFYVLSELAEFSYKCSDYYFPEHEKTLLWNDPQLDIEWPITESPLLSEKDQQGIPFSNIEYFD